MRRRRWAGYLVLAAGLIFLVAVLASGHPGTKPAAHPSPLVTASIATTPSATASATASVTATATPHHTVTPAAKPRPHATHTRSAPAPAPSSAPASRASLAPASTAPAPQPACYPLTSGGNCYRAGEYCPKADHGMSGIAGNGEAITCEDNNGWRWEPA